MSQGSVVDGNMISAPLVGGNSTCPATGIRYLPKYINVTTPSSTASASVPSVSSASVWKGNLFAASSDGTIANATCIISGGKHFFFEIRCDQSRSLTVFYQQAPGTKVEPALGSLWGMLPEDPIP